MSSLLVPTTQNVQCTPPPLPPGTSSPSALVQNQSKANAQRRKTAAKNPSPEKKREFKVPAAENGGVISLKNSSPQGCLMKILWREKGMERSWRSILMLSLGRALNDRERMRIWRGRWRNRIVERNWCYMIGKRSCQLIHGHDLSLRH